jgi:hypothetical protein
MPGEWRLQVHGRWKAKSYATILRRFVRFVA